MCLFPSASHPNLSARFVIAALASPNAKAVSMSVGLGLLLVLASGSVTTSVAQTNSSLPAPESSVSQQLLFVNPIVGHDHNGDGSQRSPFRSITRALQTAQPNTVIMLAPGTYSEESGEVFPLEMKLGVTIQGDLSTQGRGIVIRGGGTFLSPTSAGQNITILGADEAELIGVTVTNPNPRGYGVWVESSNPTITGNTLTGNTHDGISTVGNSAPFIQNNRFISNGANGITIFGSSQPEVRENVFEQTGFAINVAENAAPVIVDNYISQNKIGVLVQENARPVLRGNTIESNQQDGVTAIAHAQPNLGTSTDPGNNIFRNNQQLDINVNATDQVIPAFGNQLATDRLASNVDLTGTTPLMQPVAQTIDRSTVATITQAPSPIQSVQGVQSTPSPSTSNHSGSNHSTSAPITALPPTVAARPPEPIAQQNTAQNRAPQPVTPIAPTQATQPSTASVRSSSATNPSTVQASPVPVSVVSLPGSPILPSGISSSSTLSSNRGVTVPSPAASTNQVTSVSPVTQPVSQVPSQPAAINIPVPPPESVRQQSSIPVVSVSQSSSQSPSQPLPQPVSQSASQSVPQSIPPTIPQSVVAPAPLLTPSVASSSPSRPASPTVANAAPPSVQLAVSPRTASAQNAVYPASAPRQATSQPVAAFNAPIAIPVPPPEAATTVAIANPSVPSASRSNGSSSNTLPSENLLPVPDGDVPVGNIGDLPTIAVSQNFAYLANTGSSFNSVTRSSLRYRVVVAAEDEHAQSLVQSIVPTAFRTSIGGRPLMQVGAFSDRNNAEEALQLMNRSGLRAAIQEID